MHYEYALSSGTCHNMKSLSRNVKYLRSTLGEITSVSVYYTRSPRCPSFILHTSHVPMHQTDVLLLHTPMCFKALFFHTISLWNALPAEITTTMSLVTFKRQLKHHHLLWVQTSYQYLASVLRYLRIRCIVMYLHGQKRIQLYCYSSPLFLQTKTGNNFIAFPTFAAFQIRIVVSLAMFHV